MTCDSPSPATVAYNTLVAAARAYAPHLDQWDKFKFPVGDNTVYVTISLRDVRPDSFEEVGG